MISQTKNNIQYFKFNNLSEFENLIHFSSTRIGGVSSGHLFSLNLGYTVNDNPKNVTNNMELLAESVGFEKKKMVSPKQTHSANIGIVKSEHDIFPDSDALITNVPNICIFIRTADCVPILLFDPVKKVIAAIHSGWKGTIQKISRKTVKLMVKEYGTDPKSIIAGIGPSIGPEVYEVGSEVIEMFDNSFGKNHFVTQIEGSDKGLLNLWEVNKQILIETGIPDSQIEIAEICTYSNPELFYSARRDGVKTGRLATGIILKNNT
ncbi:MAG: peptidoglycan editing factor PgeF [Bacteroidales bacterium]|jgi:YfiH family protein|nr:peptidoglycan editing factor PgeF [Bacteroidales bacterium]